MWSRVYETVERPSHWSTAAARLVRCWAPHGQDRSIDSRRRSSAANADSVMLTHVLPISSLLPYISFRLAIKFSFVNAQHKNNNSSSKSRRGPNTLGHPLSPKLQGTRLTGPIEWWLCLCQLLPRNNCWTQGCLWCTKRDSSLTGTVG